MTISQLFQWLTNFLSQIYHLGDMNLFGNVSINDFWFGLAIMSILIGVLIVFGRSVPIHSIGSFSGYESDSKVVNNNIYYMTRDQIEGKNDSIYKHNQAVYNDIQKSKYGSNGKPWLD